MPVKKRALGRGLDALLGSDAPAQVLEPQDERTVVRKLPVTEIRPNPYQPRQHLNQETLEELAASIMEQGILQPLIVRSAADGQGYELVAGERRWRAAQRCGMTEVPAIVREFSSQEMLELALIENIQREELTPIEEARAYQQLIQEFQLTQEQVAERVGRSRVAVTNTLRLLRLPERLQQWLEVGQLTAGHARALLSLEQNEALQTALAREIINKGLSVRDAEQRVRRLLKHPRPDVKAETPDLTVEARDLQEKLSLHLGLQVKIFPKSNTSGQIEVYYSTLDEFQRFFDHLGISLE